MAPVTPIDLVVLCSDRQRLQHSSNRRSNGSNSNGSNGSNGSNNSNINSSSSSSRLYTIRHG